MSSAKDRQVNLSTLVRATPERVYDAIATAKGLDGWFTRGAMVDARPGGIMHFRWKDHGVEHYNGENQGSVLEAHRPNRFAFRWKADSGNYDTTVEMNFEKVTEGTVVRLLEYGYEDGPVGLQDYVNRVGGWAEALTLMKFYVEHGLTY